MRNASTRRINNSKSKAMSKYVYQIKTKADGSVVRQGMSRNPFFNLDDLVKRVNARGLEVSVSDFTLECLGTFATQEEARVFMIDNNIKPIY